MRGLKAQSAHNHPILNAPREGNPLLGYADDIHTCPTCGERSYRALYDCRGCRGVDIAEPVYLPVCEECGTEFTPKRTNHSRFCSRLCSNRAHSRNCRHRHGGGEREPYGPTVALDVPAVRALVAGQGRSLVALSEACGNTRTWINIALRRGRMGLRNAERLAEVLSVHISDITEPSNGGSETWKGTSAAVHGGRDGAESPSRLN